MSHSGMTGSQAQQYGATLSSGIADNTPVIMPTHAERFLHKYQHKASVIQHVLRKISIALLEDDMNIKMQGIVVNFPDVFNTNPETEVSPFQMELTAYLHNKLYPLGWDLRRHPIWPDKVIIKPLFQANLHERT